MLFTSHGSFITTTCNSFLTRFIAKSFEQLPVSPDTVAAKIEHPVFPQVGLDIAWLDHHTYTDSVIEYQGKNMFVAGDTSSVQEGRGVYPFVPPSQIFIG
ncbi:MAG: hypothetical protein ABSA44_01665 [Bacteroidota bacterium]